MHEKRHLCKNAAYIFVVIWYRLKSCDLLFPVLNYVTDYCRYFSRQSYSRFFWSHIRHVRSDTLDAIKTKELAPSSHFCKNLRIQELCSSAAFPL